ncbi:MAG: cyclic nucleotide-binding domain-containing protein [Actinobacteria bacterium]|jgi:CRP/FNR family cyclic AMP-dependent transcriptional regulator|nr:cyclic nucleotide-binding domain-containing protein [Acidimicrobiaceae bacterium]MBP6488475.1 cyclic nucleotide-binding domain-containing protein [Ilumatobacteraceae bacterium]NMD23240.1 cyclic nucleotide-binding domain-containing protein [Actinomycetota bacterium]MBP7887781.1 cyclic nucleotide-binding domain-containing protein [Ilumatobacteraceae bacterium]MBP8211371.1 cyclic nucleotide-binding domain-containing protein [Ilumatobacteraceae bacterium]
MANRGVYVEHLRRVALFAGLTKKELEQVASAGSEVDVAAGKVLMEQGHSGSDAFIVLKGTFVVRRNGRKVAELNAGDIAGELALLDDGPRSATVECISDGSVLVIGRGQFRAVLDDIPTLTHKLLAAMAGRIRNLDQSVLG